MPIYTLAEYRVKAEAIEKVKRAIESFLPHIRAEEPGTRVYAAWQKQDEPNCFVHIFIFEDEAAHAAHGTSEAVRRFEAAYGPELLDGAPVVFTDFNLVAAKGMGD